MSDYVTKTNVLNALGRFKENADDLYATDAELTDVNNALEDSEQRIENLEQAVSGSLVQTNVLTDPPSMANVRTITSANTILPWALLNRVGARATQFNQLIADGDWSHTYTVASGRTKGISTNGTSSQAHKYLISVTIIADTTVNGLQIQYGSSTVTVGNGVGTKNVIFTGGAGSDYVYSFIHSSESSSASLTVSDSWQLFDLTDMGEYDSTLTDAQNIANFRAKFPASYYPYNAGGIINLNPSGFKVVGKNKWNEQIVVGGLQSDGTVNTSETDRITTDWIPVLPNTEFYIKTPQTTNGRVCFYDAEKNLILYNSSFPQTGTFTTPPNACWMRDTPSYAYGTTYNHDIIFCLNSVTDKTYEAYKETTIDTSFTSDYKYVNENCHDYAENVYLNGVLKRKEQTVVGSVNLGLLNWSYDSQYTRFIAELPTLKASETRTLPFLCKEYLPTYVAEVTDVPNKSVYNYGRNYLAIVIHDYSYTSVGSASDPTSFLGHLQGVMLYYPLGTEDTAYGDPIPNFPCEDGTTITAVTPQTDIVNAIDVPTTIAYMTKIGA